MLLNYKIMRIQKPTVLDAARICEELQIFRGAIIRSAFRGYLKGSLYLKLDNPETLIKYITDRQFSFLGIDDKMPNTITKEFPGIDGFSIVNVKQINFDRIISIGLARKDKLGRTQEAKLIVEIMPNIGDVYFTNGDNRVKMTLKRKNMRMYQSPTPLKKPTILNVNKDQIRQILADGHNISKEIYGFNHRDLLNLSIEEQIDPDDLWHDMRAYVKQAIKPGPAWIIQAGDDYAGYSLVKPKLLKSETEIEIKNALKMYEKYFSKTAGESEAETKMHELMKIVESGQKKARMKISLIKKQLEESEMAADYKLFGELILANLGNIKKGDKSATLSRLDSSNTDEITIALDPSKSPAGNAKTYFKKSKKALASKEILSKRLLDEENRLDELDRLRALGDEETAEIEQKLIKMGFLSEKSGNIIKKPVERRKPYRTFKATCGWEILIGKSNKDNDELTFHVASKNDYWFHAWQAAGSHTVLKLPDKSSKPDKQTLLEAASLAAYYSKARNSSKVAVAYTLVKYVRKPRKFPPGKVLVEREKQLMVKPAEPDDYAFE